MTTVNCWLLPYGVLKRLEPYAGKLARTVLRGEWRRNTPFLPDFIKGGTTKTEYITDDLIDALVTGLEMAEHPPAPPPKVRRSRRSVWSRYFLRYNGELRKKLRKRRRPRTK
jgi:hypothetical protein